MPQLHITGLFTLRANGAYENTRIIIFADHGRGSAAIPENINLPGNDHLQGYNPLLLVKDFNGTGGVAEKREFMTCADVPLLALSGIIRSPKNPWTGRLLQSDKDEGVFIATISPLSNYRHSKYTYNIRRDKWLFVCGNIFDRANWRAGRD